MRPERSPLFSVAQIFNLLYRRFVIGRLGKVLPSLIVQKAHSLAVSNIRENGCPRLQLSGRVLSLSRGRGPG